ncbi:hypothetical protein STAQ_28060 [Allostella sp. ATCC 35155]|nr:hypothetical protein STAQ_28060 [Stella sp. ATCC 35155]
MAYGTLTPAQMSGAISLTFQPFDPMSEYIGWDYRAYYGTSASGAWSRDLFSFQGIQGAKYDIFSHSWYEPFLVSVHDSSGRALAYEDEDYDYGTDVIWDFIAPYTGTFYVDAAWDQGIYYTSVSVSRSS